MINILIINLFILFNIIGYTYLYKRIFLRQVNFYIFNLDLIYGIFFITFLSIFLNFFLPLKLVTLPFYIIGFFFGIKEFLKKKIFINLFLFLIILISITIISYNNGENIDSPMYHLQIINWITNYKVSFGITYLEIRYGMNSSWHNFISFFNFSIFSFESIFFISLILLSMITNEAFNINKKLSISNFFLFLSISFIYIFTLIHPLLNGIILNHLGNPEVDIAGMIFFIISFYLFLKIFFEGENKYLDLLIISSILTFTIKISYIVIVILPLIIILRLKRRFLIKNYFIYIFFILIWIFKSLISSSCIIFPLKFTCFDWGWGASIVEIDNYFKVVMSFARDTRLRNNYTDFNYTINSYGWLIPWTKDYFLNTSLLKISSLISIFSLIFILVDKFIKKKFFLFFNFKIFFIIFFFISCLYIWFKAPEIRFGWAIFICIPSFLIATEYNLFNKNKLLNHFNHYKFFLIIIIFLLVSKNLNNFNLVKIFSSNKNFDYSNIIIYGKYNNYEIFKSNDWKCYDYKLICVNIVRENYNIDKIFGYIVFKN